MNYSPYNSNSQKKNSLFNVKNSADTINKFLSPENKGLLSDNCKFSKDQESQAPGYYNLSFRTMQNQNCYMDYQNVSSGGAPLKNNIDLESELRGITRINSKCDDSRLKKKSVFNKNTISTVTPYCSSFLTSDGTRERKACKTSTEVLLNRFDFPLDQNRLINSNDFIGVNTRLKAKESLEKEDLSYNSQRRGKGPVNGLCRFN